MRSEPAFWCNWGIYAKDSRGLIREIQLKDAKARLSAVVDDALRGAEFVITRHGHKAAVVVSWERWRRVSDVPSLGHLLAATPTEAADLAERDGHHGYGNTCGRRQGRARRSDPQGCQPPCVVGRGRASRRDRILPFDFKAATIAGALSDGAAAKGLHPGFADIAVAAIAEAHTLVLLTRNVRHFRAIRDRVIDPFETLPA